MRRIYLSFGLGLAWTALNLSAGSAPPPVEDGRVVAVLYNSAMPESKTVAEHYSEKRRVPAGQVFGLDLPASEEISRADFRERLQEPLLRKLADAQLLTVHVPAPGSNQPPTNGWSSYRIRYLALCYGVPVRIESDPHLVEPAAEKLRPELRRNEAAVDSELALLPKWGTPQPLYGPAPNSLYGTTNAADLNPGAGILLVTRLDGPTAEIARSLVDKALAAETNGLWGRAYFDARGITNSNYLIGDEWMKRSAEITRRLGFETVLDEQPATFPAGYPMSQIAFYAGWYDSQVSGPFTAATVEFMPGAIAYHLHSFSARAVRTPDTYWVGPLLQKGATATMGCVAEPYLEGTPDIATFFARMIYFGFSFGEAAYAGQSVLSWQTTVVGDPLYRPFGISAKERHQQLLERNSSWIEWSDLRVVDLNSATGLPPKGLIQYVASRPEAKESSVLQEKLGDLKFVVGDFTGAIGAYRAALQREPTPLQRVRLMVNLAKVLAKGGKEEEAFAAYEQVLKEHPDYPDREYHGLGRAYAPMPSSNEPLATGKQR